MTNSAKKFQMHNVVPLKLGYHLILLDSISRTGSSSPMWFQTSQQSLQHFKTCNNFKSPPNDTFKLGSSLKQKSSYEREIWGGKVSM